MLRHRVALLVVALLCLVACTTSDAEQKSREAYSACPGVHFDDVRGPVPAYAEPPLARFTNDGAMCRGLWLPFADDWFVPQGLALDGDTAWVSGYRWSRSYGDRPCRLMHVDLRTGRLLATTARLTGSVGGRKPTFCRHGGALSLDRHGLWLGEGDWLQLVDSARVGHGDAVLRVWRTERPVRGSVLLDGSTKELALLSWSDQQEGRTRWYSYRDLLADGVTTLVPGPVTEPAQAGTTRTMAAVRRVQGATAGRGGIWSTSSSSTCGMLATPGGRRLAFAPGAEDLQPDGRGHVWVVLESGARTYQRDGRPLVPMLAQFDVDALLKGASESCDW